MSDRSEKVPYNDPALQSIMDNIYKRVAAAVAEAFRTGLPVCYSVQLPRPLKYIMLDLGIPFHHSRSVVLTNILNLGPDTPLRARAR